MGSQCAGVGDGQQHEVMKQFVDILNKKIKQKKEKTKMLEKIIELTADTLGANAAEITAETSFMDDLHADSLDLFELAMALEEEFSVEIPSEDLEKITTVADAMNYLTEHQA